MGSVIMMHDCLPTTDTVETYFRPDRPHGFDCSACGSTGGRVRLYIPRTLCMVTELKTCSLLYRDESKNQVSSVTKHLLILRLIN